MTERQKRQWVLGIVGTLLTAMLLRIGASAWEREVTTPLAERVTLSEFSRHLADRNEDAIRDSSWKAEQRAMTLEILCQLKERDRRCR